MILRKKIAAFCASLLLLVACGNPYSEQIKTVKDMQTELQGYEDAVNTVDVSILRDMQQEYGKVMSVIKAKYIDSNGVDQRFGRMANLYKGIKKTKGIPAAVENTLVDIAEQKTQLENLLDDLENQDIPELDTVNHYINIERAALNEIKMVAEKLRVNYQTLLGVQDTVYPYMLGIVDSLNKIR